MQPNDMVMFRHITIMLNYAAYNLGVVKIMCKREVGDWFNVPAFSCAGSENLVVLSYHAFLSYGDVVHLPCSY